MKNVALTAAMATALAAVMLGQTTGGEFEVASIKPTVTRDGSLSVNFPPGGRFSARNLTLKQLLQNAYRLQGYQIAGVTGWIDSAGFDIEAKAGAGTGEPPREQVLQMLQSLLGDRFHLTLHRETRQLPIYVLVVGRNGPKLQAANGSGGQTQTRMGQIIVQKMSTTELANILTFDLKRPVKDQTGLKGEYAFTLEWTPGLGDSDDGPGSRPSLFAAVQDQLGLKLESTKGPIEVLVIDSAAKPTEN